MSFHRKERPGMSAIFIHAGAGFHSFQTEETHLWVCNQAATLAMAVLKTGGRAVDAVEVAIKFLEDHEITNAGYGSNLSANGTVECDATIVDHLGRSGAVGAVESIKNPISLARMVLDNSIKPMSLNRVPPNLLVGSGATDFAYENGMPILHADFLVAKGSKERWLRWKHDLDQLEDPQNQIFGEDEYQSSVHSSPSAPRSSPGAIGSSPAASRQSSLGLISAIQSPGLPGNPLAIGHINSVQISDGSKRSASTIADGHQRPAFRYDDVDADCIDDMAAWSLMKATSSSSNWMSVKMPNLNSTHESCPTEIHATSKAQVTADFPPPLAFGRSGLLDSNEQAMDSLRLHIASKISQQGCPKDAIDSIIDTVGAIAVDRYGNIAAGSSSGGIGMKHSGRTGPAALVGIGTAVIPVDPEDEMKTCVAVVTSGTGEHMATTMASSLCAERIYSSTRKKPGLPGVYESVSEDEAMEAMISTDFMGHPGVKCSNCHAAIGIMAVKKTKEGITFVFGHNTDSFVMASMNSEDMEPYCLMSRSKGNGKIAQGGRVTRFSSKSDKGGILRANQVLYHDRH